LWPRIFRAGDLFSVQNHADSVQPAKQVTANKPAEAGDSKQPAKQVTA
jgi:hypothetical protein